MNNSENVKMLFACFSSIFTIAYWLIFISYGNHIIGIFEMIVTLLVAERLVDLHDFIYRKLEDLERKNQESNNGK